MRNLKGLADEMGVKEEALRSFVRRSPALRPLGQKIGQGRIYSPAACRRIRQAFINRTAATST